MTYHIITLYEFQLMDNGQHGRTGAHVVPRVEMGNS